MIRRSLAAVGVSLGLLLAAGAYAQDQRLTVVVVYIAGADIYLDAGADRGLGPGDTLKVYRPEGSTFLGTFQVISSTAERAVVTFAGRPFPVTRGTRLQVTAGGRAEPAGKDDAAARAAAAAVPTQIGSLPGSAPRMPHLSGRLALDLGVLQSTTSVGDGLDPVARRFATPSLRLRATVEDLPGGMNFTTNLRAALRMSSADIVEPPQSLRLYQASLGKSFETVPLQFQLGRFYNPYETFSGYTDGLLVHLGRSGLGGGIAIGFQPDRGNEAFTTDAPKYGAFLDYQHTSRSTSYYADLSYNELRPRNGLPALRFAGLDQRLRWGAFGLTQRVRFDSQEGKPGWKVTQVELRTTLPLGPGLYAGLGYSYWRPLAPLYLPDLGPNAIVLPVLESQRASVSIDYNMFGGSIGADVTGNRVQGEAISYTYGAHFSFPRSDLLGLGFFAWASYWKRDATTTLYIAPGVTRSFGSLQSRASYSRYSFTNASAGFVTHTLDLTLAFPLTWRWYLLLQGRVQRSKTLNSDNIYTGLWLSF